MDIPSIRKQSRNWHITSGVPQITNGAATETYRSVQADFGIPRPSHIRFAIIRDKRLMRSDDDKDISSDELRLRGKIYKHHIHAVIALKPTGQEFRRPLLVAGSAHQDQAFGHVMIEQFNPAKSTLANMIEYCSKGSMSVDNGRAHADMWQVFPVFREKTKKRPAQQIERPSLSVRL